MLRTAFLVAGVYAGFAWCITSTLQQMTVTDCARGIQSACIALERIK